MCETSCSTTASVVDGLGYCCKDVNAKSCTGAGADDATSCANVLGYYLLPTSSTATSGNCESECGDYFYNAATNQCVKLEADCPAGTVGTVTVTTSGDTTTTVTADANGLTHCCSTGTATCDVNGASTKCVDGYTLRLGACTK